MNNKHFQNVEKYIDEHNTKPWYKRCEKLDKFKVWDIDNWKKDIVEL